MLQVTQVKVFQLEPPKSQNNEEGVDQPAKSKKKLNIKAKIGLSDGIAQIMVLVPEPVFNKMKQTPKQFDIIKVDNLSKQNVSETLLCMIKSPLIVLDDKVDKLLGNPMDLKKLINSKESIEFDQEFDIPQQHIEQKKVEEIKPVIEPIVED